MKKLTSLVLAVAASVGLSASAQAAMGGHKVVLVHGYQTSHLYAGPQTEAQLTSNGDNYWSGFWKNKGDYRLDWDSTQRIEGSIADRAYDKVMTLVNDNTGNSAGYVFVTHSTGDLVTRYLLDNMNVWTDAAGKPRLNVTAVIDFAGAGGGSEMGDFATDAQADTSWYMQPFYAAVSWFMGGSTSMPSNLGVLNDLRVSNARNIATTPNSVPRLRFVGGGDDTYVGVTKPILAGSDDSVVALHSACGAVNARGIDSCSKNIKLDGLKKSANGPDGLVYNNYPILQGEDISHGGIINHPDTGGFYSVIEDELAWVNNNFSANGLNVDFNTYVYKYKPWWYGFWASADYYNYVRDSGSKNVSQIVYDTFNN